jgi:hypothetical protein
MPKWLKNIAGRVVGLAVGIGAVYVGKKTGIIVDGETQTIIIERALVAFGLGYLAHKPIDEKLIPKQPKVDVDKALAERYPPSSPRSHQSPLQPGNSSSEVNTLNRNA